MKGACFAALLFFFPALVWASADRLITFTQTDCPEVDHWDVYVNGEYLEPVVPPCAELMSAAVTIPGVGNRLVSMKAVAPDGTESAFSNEIGTLVPLAAPNLVSVD